MQLKRGLKALLSCAVAVCALFFSASLALAAQSTVVIKIYELSPTATRDFTIKPDGTTGLLELPAAGTNKFYTSAQGIKAKVVSEQGSEIPFTSHINGVTFTNEVGSKWTLQLESGQSYLPLFYTEAGATQSQFQIDNSNNAHYVLTSETADWNYANDAAEIRLYVFRIPMSVKLTTDQGLFSNNSKEQTLFPGGISYYDGNTSFTTEPNNFVFFNNNGVPYGSNIGFYRSALPEPLLSKDEIAAGWEFRGWQVNGGDTVYSSSEILNAVVKGDVTLKANFVKVDKKGEKGDKGDTGAQGPQGQPGKDGVAGPVTVIKSNTTVLQNTAVAGPAGKDGVNGKDGINGKDGRDGKDGKDGKDGESCCEGSFLGIELRQLCCWWWIFFLILLICGIAGFVYLKKQIRDLQKKLEELAPTTPEAEVKTE